MKEKETLNTADYLLLANIVGATVKDFEERLDPNDEKSKEILEVMNELHSKLKRINSNKNAENCENFCIFYVFY